MARPFVGAEHAVAILVQLGEAFGEEGVELGLVDSIGDLRTTLRARFGDKVLTPVIAPASGPLAGLLGRRSAGTGSLLEAASQLPAELISALEARAVWARFGF